jgi:signal transduction histidine kinase
MISITVTDNGKGFEADKYLSLQMSSMDSIGTENRQLPGISSHGLGTVQQIVKENNGTFEISSSDSGTQIFIDLPFPTTK